MPLLQTQPCLMQIEHYLKQMSWDSNNAAGIRVAQQIAQSK